MRDVIGKVGKRLEERKRGDKSERELDTLIKISQ